MRVAYFDCFCGASGNMICGACVDAGVDIESFRRELATLGVDGYTIEANKVRKQGFAATHFEVRVDPDTPKPHRHLQHVNEIIDNAKLPDKVRQNARAVFQRLAEVEAAAHGTTIDKVHFHEVGAIDAIVDVVGACLGLERLGVERVYCSPIPTGSGTVTCDHGILPVPAPATAALLVGVPLADCDEVGELTTPTGAAILTTLAESFGPMPAMVIDKIGFGAGAREGRKRPNVLRLIVGETADAPGDDEESDQVLVLEANLDDISGEVIGHTYDRLFDAGALDVYTTPIYMKKNRPASVLTVLTPPALRETMETILFSETTTFGIRSHLVERRKLARTTETVETELGPIRVKVGKRAGEVMTVAPEFEDCKQAARRSSKPLHDIMDLAMRAWWAGSKGSTS